MAANPAALQCSWVVYLLLSHCAKRTYVGATTDAARRLRQHNGLLAGGARATRALPPPLAAVGSTEPPPPKWSLACVVDGFSDKREALRFEWRWKHAKRRPRGSPGPPAAQEEDLIAAASSFDAPAAVRSITRLKARHRSLLLALQHEEQWKTSLRVSWLFTSRAETSTSLTEAAASCSAAAAAAANM